MAEYHIEKPPSPSVSNGTSSGVNGNAKHSDLEISVPNTSTVYLFSVLSLIGIRNRSQNRIPATTSASFNPFAHTPSKNATQTSPFSKASSSKSSASPHQPLSPKSISSHPY